MPAAQQTSRLPAPGYGTEVRGRLVRVARGTAPIALLTAVLGQLLTAHPAHANDAFSLQRDRRRQPGLSPQEERLLVPSGQDRGQDRLFIPRRLRVSLRETIDLGVARERRNLARRRQASLQGVPPNADGHHWPLQTLKTVNKEYPRLVGSLLPWTEQRIKTLLDSSQEHLFRNNVEEARRDLSRLRDLVRDDWMPQLSSLLRAAQVSAEPGFEHLSETLQSKIDARQRKIEPLWSRLDHLHRVTATILGFAELGALETTSWGPMFTGVLAIGSNLGRLRDAGASSAAYAAWDRQLDRYIKKATSTAYAAVASLPLRLRAKCEQAIGAAEQGNTSGAQDSLRKLSKLVADEFHPGAVSVLSIVTAAIRVSEKTGAERRTDELTTWLKRQGSRAHDANNAAQALLGHVELLALFEPHEWTANPKAADHVVGIRKSVVALARIISGEDGGSANIAGVVEELAPGRKYVFEEPGAEARGQPMQLAVKWLKTPSKVDLWVAGGYTTWRRILENFLKNAKKHGRATTMFLDQETLANGSVQLTLFDDGDGIRPDRRESLWKSKRHGLAGVKRKVEDLNGTVQLEGDEGSTFQIIVPPAPIAAAE